MTPRRWLAAALLAGLPAVACEGAPEPAPVDPSVRTLVPPPDTVPLVILFRLDGNEEAFGRVSDATFVGPERLAVLDGQAQAVFLYDVRDGSRVPVATSGRGPGEIQSARALDSDGERLVVFEGSGEVEVFDAAGRHVELIRRERLDPDRSLIDSAGDLVLVEGREYGTDLKADPWKLTEGGPYSVEVTRAANMAPPPPRAVVFASTDGTDAYRVADTLDLVPAPDASVKVDLPAGRIVFGFDYRPRGWSSLSPMGYQLSGRTDSPDVIVHAAPDSTITLRTSRPPVPLGSGLKEVLDGQAGPLGDPFHTEVEGPFHVTHKPVYHRVVPGRDGSLWMRLHVPSERVVVDGEEQWLEREAVFDVLSPTGEVHGTYRGPATVRLVQVSRRCALMIEVGAFDVTSVVVMGPESGGGQEVSACMGDDS